MLNSRQSKMMALASLFAAGMSHSQDCVQTTQLGPRTNGQLSNEVVLSGDLAVLADGAWGMRIFDMADISNPVLLSATTNPGGSLGVAVVGTTAYLATGNDLRSFDISDPSAPVLVDLYDPGSILAVVASGNVVYASTGTSVHALNVSDPNQMIPGGGAGTPGGGVNRLAVHEDLLFAVGADVTVYDISNPLGPVLVGSFDTPGSSHGIAVRDGIAYVANGISGLRVLDISHPANISEIVRVRTDADALSVAVSGKYVYLGMEFGFVEIYDILVPTDPVYVGKYDVDATSGADTHSIVFKDNAVISASSLRGIHRFSIFNHCDECLPDVNGNGVLNSADFNSWISSFNSGSSACDQNGDRECTPADFTAWIANYNTGCP